MPLKRSSISIVLLLLTGLAVTAAAQVPVNPLLTQHSNFFDPAQIWDIQKDAYSKPHRPAGLTYQVYSAVGYDLANTIVIVGPTKELIIVDTLGDRQSATAVLAEFRKQNLLPPGKLPIKTIIYTHNHIDHTGGVEGFLLEADRPACAPETSATQGDDTPYNADLNDPGCVSIIGQENIVESVTNTALVVGTMINPRSAYMYGSFLLPEGPVNDGIGPQVNKGEAGFRMPSRTFSQQLQLTAAGVNMELTYVPSETDDELSVFLPDAANGGQRDGASGLLLSAEVIQGPSFPNLYSLRGTSYRNPAQWFRSVDVLRKYDSWCMLPAHGTPLCGQKNIELLLRNFRDAIQYTHDQTVRYLNKGQTMEELPLIVAPLPQYLIDELDPIQTARADTSPRDYLRDFYGSVQQASRELYFGYLGWFQADPVGLAPTPPVELARRTIEMMGGKDKVYRAAERALKTGTEAEAQWAAELTTLLVRVNHEDCAAREVKAEAFKRLAAPKTNPNWRNWYLTSARELRCPSLIPGAAITSGLVSPGIVAALPAGLWVSSWSIRLRAEETARPGQRVNESLGFWFPAPNQGYGDQGFVLHIRGAIAEFIETGSDQSSVMKANLVVSMTKAAQEALVQAEAFSDPNVKPQPESKAKRDAGELAERYKNLHAVIDREVAAGNVKILKGTPEEVKAFFLYFDPKPVNIQALTVR
jgi:alkyl sulfatase BDS1-like metallo-beta-lactamase superfamily hydrolase